MRYAINNVFGELTSMPGCSQIAISHDVFTPKALRGKGHAKAANFRRIHMAADLGYDMLICTVASDNFVQREIMYANGWNKLTWYTSTKTGHNVQLWCIELADYTKESLIHKRLDIVTGV